MLLVKHPNGARNSSEILDTGVLEFWRIGGESEVAFPCLQGFLGISILYMGPVNSKADSC